MEWTVWHYNSNRDKIESYNIFDHGSFNKDARQHLKECQTKEEFADKLKSELRYYFWSKSQWELIVEITEDNRIFLNPWVGCREPEKVRIDVTDNTDFDWRSFAELHTKKQIYSNEAKIDVFDQVTMNWEMFCSYVWEHKKSSLSRD